MEEILTNKRLETIIQKLIINGTLVSDPGLFHGKMGIAIFFFHYGCYITNDLFQGYAMDLIDEIQAQITMNEPVRYDVGLAGIGVGIEYLIQKNFLEADADDILSDFDERMCRVAMYEPYSDCSLEKGLIGWGRYFLYRLTNCSAGLSTKLYEALNHIIYVLEEVIKKDELSETEKTDIFYFLKDLTQLPSYTNFNIGNINISHSKDNQKKPDSQILSTSNDMGLLEGYAYEGMNCLAKLGYTDDSWKQLLSNS